MLRRLRLLALAAATAASDESMTIWPAVHQLQATVKAQAAELAALKANREALRATQERLESQNERLGAGNDELTRQLEAMGAGRQLGNGPDRPTDLSGRKLTGGSTALKWHEGLLHSFADPTSAGCELHADLDHASTGPLTMKRTPSGDVQVAYGSDSKFSISAPLTVEHPSGCAAASLVASLPFVLPPTSSMTLKGVDLTDTLFPSVKIKVTTWTGSTTYPGMVNVYYSTWDSDVLTVLSEQPDFEWDEGDVVVPETAAIEKFRAVYLRNANTNGWVGRIEASVDGGTEWIYLNCVGCWIREAPADDSDLPFSGALVTSAKIVVDMNADASIQATSYCVNGDYCAFVLPTYAFTPPPQKSCAQTLDCEFMGVNAGSR